HKLFDLDIRRLNCSIVKENRVLRLHVSHSILVNSFAFEMEKGSFIKGRKLTGSFLVDYNTASKILQFQQARVAIDDHPFVFSGRFFPTVVPDPFFLAIEAKDIPYREATALLTPNLRQKLEHYEIDRPVSILAQLDAGSADDQTPQIQVRLDL